MTNCHTRPPLGGFFMYYRNMNNTEPMTVLNLTQTEAALLNDIFASVADLDLTEHMDDETVFDTLWDKVTQL